MKRKQPTIAAIAVAAALAATAAHAGYRLTDERGMRTEISKGRMKQTMTGNVPVQSSLDVGAGRMWMANTEKKVYWEGPIDEFCGQMKQAVGSMQSAMKANIEAHMKDMAPDQKAKMQAMLKNLGGDEGEAKAPKTRLVKTDETETIAGLPTRKVQLVVDGEVTGDFWITTDPGLSKELRLDKAAATMSKFRNCQSSSKGLGQMSAMQDVFSQGFPLKTVTYVNGKMLMGQSYNKVETAEIADAEFTPPPGFQKVTLQEAMFAGAPNMKGAAPEHAPGKP